MHSLLFFFVVGTQNYCYDNIKVYRNGSRYSSFGPFCGTNSPDRLVFRGQVSIIFRSDSIVSGSGFKFEYHITSNAESWITFVFLTNLEQLFQLMSFLPDVLACGGNLTNMTGVVASPTYPNRYDGNSNCTWFITVPPQYAVELRYL